MSSPIILASESPFRKNLMNQIGLEFEAARPLIDEDQMKDQALPTDLPAFLAKAKAASLIETHPNSIIIGSDQVLILKGQVLNKPKTRDEVIERLEQLQGQTHTLHTGLAVYHQGQWDIETIIAEMAMRELSKDEIERYCDLDQAVGCAGGYKIESRGPLLFSSIKTEDHFSIIGLPLLSLTSILRKLGISPL
ncbi:MAG: septum formation protein Maf [Bdellovibrionales bacterium]|nr:Maf family protein [Bdellovibrionales bacterium]NQZ18031.1 septum formation protein Maf [Bdellovibrionales bacterium]